MSEKNLLITEFNVLTGESIERDYTSEELAELELIEQEEAARIAEKQAKEAARASALAKLAALGLTEEEIAAL